MKKIITYTLLTLFTISSIAAIAFYSFNLGKNQEYDRLNNKYVFNCIEPNNQTMSHEQKKECYAKMYKNKLSLMQDLFTIDLAIEHLDGNFLSSLSNEKYMKDIYPILLNKCFKTLQEACVDKKFNKYNELEKTDVINFFKDLDYVLTSQPQYKFTSHSLLMEILRLNPNICSDMEYSSLINKLKNNESIKHMDTGMNTKMHGATASYYGSCNKYVYNLQD